MLKYVLAIAALLCLLLNPFLSDQAILVPAGGDLQAAINSAQCGGTVLLQAGATWDSAGPENGFKFPNRGCAASNPIRVASSSATLLPQGRVSAADTVNMARLRGRGGPAITFASGASCWILDGLEITNTGSDSEFVPTLIDATDPSVHTITIQRSYIHPKETGLDYSRSVNRAIYYNGSQLLFRWNYAAGFMGTSTVEGTLMTSAVFLTVKGHDITIEDNFLEASYAAIFTGGGQTEPEYIAAVSSATTSSATFSNTSGLTAGVLIRFEIKGTGTLSGNTLTRTSGEQLDPGDKTPIYDGTNAVHLTEINGGTQRYRFALTSVNGDLYGLSPFNGGAPSGTYNWTLYQVAMVKSVSGNVVQYEPYGVNFLRHSPTLDSEAAWRVTPVVRKLAIVGNTFNIDVPNAEWQHSTFGENPKGWWEFKDCTDCLIEANTFIGYPSTMGMVPRSDEGVTPWSTMKGIVVRNNLFNLTAEPAGEREWFIASGDDNYNSSTPGGEFLITNNLVLNVNSMGFVRALRNSEISRNTIINRPNSTYGSKVFQSDVDTNVNLKLRDNIFGNNAYGISCLMPGSFTACFPGLDFQRNVIVDNANGGNLAVQYSEGVLLPIVSSFPEVGFASDYRLLLSSPFKGRATDGTDPGVNIDQLLVALGGIPTPTPTPTPTPLPSPSPTPTPSVTPTPVPSPSPTPLPSPSPSPSPTPKPSPTPQPCRLPNGKAKKNCVSRPSTLFKNSKSVIG